MLNIYGIYKNELAFVFITESNETCTLDDGKVVIDGATWSKSECTLCSCKNGLVLCEPNPHCPKLPGGCSKIRVPKGKCCPVCLGIKQNNYINFFRLCYLIIKFINRNC